VFHVLKQGFHAILALAKLANSECYYFFKNKL